MRPHQPQARASPRRWNDPQRLHEARIDADPFEHGLKCAELECSIGSVIEMLQGAAAALAEMPARRFGAPAPAAQPLDDPAFATATAALAEPGTYAVARYREGQEYRFSAMFGDPVAARADPLDDKLDKVVAVPLVPAT